MAAGFKSATVTAAKVPSTQTDFPSYVDLSRLGITTLAEAQSVRVYADSAKTTEWAREIVSATEMHVKIPSLTSTVSIYVDWDGVRADYAVTDIYGRNAVWRSEFKGVWHLNEASGTRYDSTGNGNNLTDNGSVGSTTGAISGNAAAVTGGSKYLSITDAAQNGLDMDAGDQVSVSNWIYPLAYADMAVAHKYAHPSGQAYSYRNYFNDASTSGVSIWYSATGDTTVATAGKSTTASALNTWHHLAAVLNAPSKALEGFKNGASAGTWAGSGADPAAIYNTTQPFIIGRRPDAAWQMNAYIDEVKVWAGLFPSGWITTEYNNQSNEATFWGTWTTVAGGTNPSRLLMMGVG